MDGWMDEYKTLSFVILIRYIVLIYDTISTLMVLLNHLMSEQKLLMFDYFK